MLSWVIWSDHLTCQRWPWPRQCTRSPPPQTPPGSDTSPGSPSAAPGSWHNNHHLLFVPLTDLRPAFVHWYLKVSSQLSGWSLCPWWGRPRCPQSSGCPWASASPAPSSPPGSPSRPGTQTSSPGPGRCCPGHKITFIYSSELLLFSQKWKYFHIPCLFCFWFPDTGFGCELDKL